MTLHRWRVLTMTSLLFADGIARSNTKLAAASAGKAADDSKSEAELVNVAGTLKRAISERMRVIRFPSHRQRETTVVL